MWVFIFWTNLSFNEPAFEVHCFLGHRCRLLPLCFLTFPPLTLSSVTCHLSVWCSDCFPTFNISLFPIWLFLFRSCVQLGGFRAPRLPGPAVHPGEGRVPQLGGLQRLSVLPHRALHVPAPHLLRREYLQRRGWLKWERGNGVERGGSKGAREGEWKRGR